MREQHREREHGSRQTVHPRVDLEENLDGTAVVAPDTFGLAGRGRDWGKKCRSSPSRTSIRMGGPDTRSHMAWPMQLGSVAAAGHRALLLAALDQPPSRSGKPSRLRDLFWETGWADSLQSMPVLLAAAELARRPASALLGRRGRSGDLIRAERRQQRGRRGRTRTWRHRRPRPRRATTEPSRAGHLQGAGFWLLCSETFPAPPASRAHHDTANNVLHSTLMEIWPIYTAVTSSTPC